MEINSIDIYKYIEEKTDLWFENEIHNEEFMEIQKEIGAYIGEKYRIYSNEMQFYSLNHLQRFITETIFIILSKIQEEKNGTI